MFYDVNLGKIIDQNLVPNAQSILSSIKIYEFNITIYGQGEYFQKYSWKKEYKEGLSCGIHCLNDCYVFKVNSEDFRDDGKDIESHVQVVVNTLLDHNQLNRNAYAVEISIATWCIEFLDIDGNRVTLTQEDYPNNQNDIISKISFGDLKFADGEGGYYGIDRYIEIYQDETKKRNAQFIEKYFVSTSNKIGLDKLKNHKTTLIINQNKDNSISINNYFFKMDGDISLQENDIVKLIDNNSVSIFENFMHNQKLIEVRLNSISVENEANEKIGSGYHLIIENMTYKNQENTQGLIDYELPDGLWQAINNATIKDFFNNFQFKIQPFIIEDIYTLLMDMGSSSSVIAKVHTQIVNGLRTVNNPKLIEINPHSEQNVLESDEVIVLNDSIDAESLMNVDVQLNQDSGAIFDNLSQNLTNEGRANYQDVIRNNALERNDCYQSPALFGLEWKEDKYHFTHLHNQGLYGDFVKEFPNRDEQKFFMQNTKNYLRYPQFKKIYNFCVTDDDFSIHAIDIPVRTLLTNCYASKLGFQVANANNAMFELHGNGNVMKNQTCQRVIMAVPNVLRHDEQNNNIQVEVFRSLLCGNDILKNENHDNIVFIPEAYAVLFNHIRNHDAITESARKTYVVFDMGAGTTDVTVAQLSREVGGRRLNILAQASSHKAGNYIDYLIARNFYQYLQIAKGGGNNIELVNPDALIEYCMTGAGDDLRPDRLQKIMIENRKKGTDKHYGSYSGFDADFEEYYRRLLDCMKKNNSDHTNNSNDVNSNGGETSIFGCEVFASFQAEIQAMTVQYIDALVKLAKYNLSGKKDEKDEIESIEVIVSGRSSLWSPIHMALNNSSYKIVGYENMNVNDKKHQVCKGLANSLTWQLTRNIQRLSPNKNGDYYQDSLAHQYHEVYIIALGREEGRQNIEINPIVYEYYYELERANEALRAGNIDQIYVYYGVQVTDSGAEDDVKEMVQNNNGYYNPNFPKKELGNLMDKNTILQMCQASYAVAKQRMMLKKEGKYLKLCMLNQEDVAEEAIVFPYLENQRINGVQVNVCEILPMSFYQANWPNPMMVGNNDA